jgi:putative ABC transport system ATP-binding protein
VWYYQSSDQKELGPISLDELQGLARTGAIRPNNLVWLEGTSKWLPAASVPGLFPDRPVARAPRLGGGAAETSVALPSLDAKGDLFFLEEKPAAWYYAQSRPQRLGPFSEPDFRNLATNGQLRPTDMVWLEGTPRWVPAGTVPDLFPDKGRPGVPSAAEAIAATSAEIHLDTKVAISCRGVVKAFGEGNARTLALRGVDLDVYTGMMTLIIGQSGCGKTTLMSVVAGTLDATEGTVSIFDRLLTGMSQSEMVRFRGETIGFVFQQFNLLPSLTAAENAAIPLLIAGWSRRRAVARASELLKKIGMEKRLHHLPRMLSGGQQQRVAIARALVHEPRLLVCDEPTSALDAETGQTVMELLKEMAVHPDRAVIVVTHDSRIFDFSDRTVHMEDGRVVTIEERPGLKLPLSTFTSDRLRPVELKK